MARQKIGRKKSKLKPWHWGIGKIKKYRRKNERTHGARKYTKQWTRSRAARNRAKAQRRTPKRTITLK